MSSNYADTQSRILAKLVRELLASERFESVADLTAALKARCVKLRLRCTADDVTDTYRLLESNTELASYPAIQQFRVLSPFDEGVIPKNEAAQIYHALQQRHQAAHPQELPAVPPVPDTDPDPALTARLSALDESYVLEWFWLMAHGTGERLSLLRQLSRVVLNRPSDWDASKVRRDHQLHRWHGADRPGCFACGTFDPVYRHHLIEVQHGGSNAVRNQVPLCFACHKFVHPWLESGSAPRGVRGFESVGSILRRVDVKR